MRRKAKEVTLNPLTLDFHDPSQCRHEPHHQAMTGSFDHGRRFELALEATAAMRARAPDRVAFPRRSHNPLPFRVAPTIGTLDPGGRWPPEFTISSLKGVSGCVPQ